MRPRTRLLACFASALCVLAYGMVEERLIGWQGEVARDSRCAEFPDPAQYGSGARQRPGRGAAPFVVRRLAAVCTGAYDPTLTRAQ